MKIFYSSLENLKQIKANFKFETEQEELEFYAQAEFIFSPLVSEEKASMFEEAYKREMRKKINFSLMDNELSHEAPALQKIYNENKLKKEERKPWLLITINCKEGEWQNIWKDIHHLKSTCWLYDAIVTVEQRGDTEATCGHLPHFHILCKKYKIEPKKAHARMWQKWGKYCGDKKHIYVNKVAHEFKEEKLQYVTGGKIDPDKLGKQEIDKKFRKKYNLKDWYSLDILPTSISKPRGGVRVGAGRPKKVTLTSPVISPKHTLIEF